MTRNFLLHIGVLGMRWGHRSADASVARDLGHKRLSELSNDEIRALATRIDLEKQYTAITARQVNPGREFVNSVMLGAGKTVATTYATKFLTSAVEGVLKEVFVDTAKAIV